MLSLWARGALSYDSITIAENVPSFFDTSLEILKEKHSGLFSSSNSRAKFGKTQQFMCKIDKDYIFNWPFIELDRR